jgi:hypothetical protein
MQRRFSFPGDPFEAPEGIGSSDESRTAASSIPKVLGVGLITMVHHQNGNVAVLGEALEGR